MQFSASQIAPLISGVIEGDASVLVSNFGKIESAQPGDLAFLANPKYESFAYTTKASILLVANTFAPKQPVASTLIRVEDPYAALAQLMQLVEQQSAPRLHGISPKAHIADDVELGEGVYVAPFAVIEPGAKIGRGCQVHSFAYISRDVTLGEGTVIYPQVTLYHGVRVGARCIIHAGAVLGSDGFGFAPESDGYHKIPQLGSVLVEDDVEIGANTCIDRAVMDNTVIRRGVKLDNLIQIAHNCEVGEHTVMASQVGLAGSSAALLGCHFARRCVALSSNLSFPICTAAYRHLRKNLQNSKNNYKSTSIMTKQKTLKAPFSLSGKGLHTGLDIQITFLPAPAGTGRVIRRVDLEGTPEIPALSEFVKGTERGTVLVKGDASVSTVEHAMAALYAKGVDNCYIEVNAPEFPILDGSARLYVEGIDAAGLEEQDLPVEHYIVKRRQEVVSADGRSRIVLLPDSKFGVDVHISFDSPVLSNQFASLEDLADFDKEIASCRTFVFVREVEMLLANNLIKGGDLDNALVIYDEPMAQENLDKICDLMKVTRRTDLSLGYINNAPIIFPNEPARHKLLDVLGDLALIGRPIRGRILAYCPGHKINNEMGAKIRKDIKLNEAQAPLYDPNATPILEVNRIRELLPHRYPFLMVDKIIEIGTDYIVGVKSVSGNEPFFQGHFPTEPVMPGVLQVEAMAQVGGLLVLNTIEDPEKYSTYFMKIDNVKFRQKVVPGDTLVFKLRLLGEIRRGVANMRGLAFVGEKLVCEAEFMAQVAKNK